MPKQNKPRALEQVQREYEDLVKQVSGRNIESKKEMLAKQAKVLDETDTRLAALLVELSDIAGGEGDSQKKSENRESLEVELFRKNKTEKPAK